MILARCYGENSPPQNKNSLSFFFFVQNRLIFIIPLQFHYKQSFLAWLQQNRQWCSNNRQCSRWGIRRKTRGREFDIRFLISLIASCSIPVLLYFPSLPEFRLITDKEWIVYVTFASSASIDWIFSFGLYST